MIYISSGVTVLHPYARAKHHEQIYVTKIHVFLLVIEFSSVQNRHH